jgi:hypothetical protein
LSGLGRYIGDYPFFLFYVDCLMLQEIVELPDVRSVVLEVVGMLR